MGFFSKFYGEGKTKHQQKVRSNQFIKMFGQVSSILGLLGWNLDVNLVKHIFETIGDIDNSSDVFIQIVMILYSLDKERGMVLLREMGRGSVKGLSPDHIIDSFSKSELSSIKGIILKSIPDMKMVFEGVSRELLKEPFAIVVGFLDHVTDRIEMMDEGLISPEGNSPRKSLGPRMSMRRNNGMVPKLELSKRGVNEIDSTRVVEENDAFEWY